MKITNLIIFGFLLSILIAPSFHSISSPISKIAIQDCTSLIEVEKIWFNWGLKSQAIPLKGCDEEETLLETPEYDRSINRDNPAAYVKGSRVTVKVQFSSELFDNVLIKTLGTFGGLSETQVVFEDSQSNWTSMISIDTLSDSIKTYDVKWDWYFFNNDTNEWTNFDTTSQTIYSLNKAPLTDSVYENLTRWTTAWCEVIPKEDQNNDKKIADAIMNGFSRDNVIRYGGPGWDSAEILRTGDGMCSGLSWLFFDACATQGVEVYGMKFRLLDTNIFDQEILWNGIITKKPGLGRTEPGLGSEGRVWRLVNSVYPYPEYYGNWDETDDIDAEISRAYIFYKRDGHVVNLLDYNGEVFLYDLSFGKGPYLNTFSSMPQEGRYTSHELRNFRENYHDIAFEYMNGIINFIDEEGKRVINETDFCVKTSIIPDEIDGNNQLLYYLDIGWYTSERFENKHFDKISKIEEILFSINHYNIFLLNRIIRIISNSELIDCN